PTGRAAGPRAAAAPSLGRAPQRVELEFDDVAVGVSLLEPAVGFLVRRAGLGRLALREQHVAPEVVEAEGERIAVRTRQALQGGVVLLLVELDTREAQARQVLHGRLLAVGCRPLQLGLRALEVLVADILL